MYSKWYSHLKTEKEITEFKYSISAAKFVLERLSELLEEEAKVSETLMRSKESYVDAAWPYKQADSLGEQRAYGKALKLIRNAIEENVRGK